MRQYLISTYTLAGINDFVIISNTSQFTYSFSYRSTSDGKERSYMSEMLGSKPNITSFIFKLTISILN